MKILVIIANEILLSDCVLAFLCQHTAVITVAVCNFRFVGEQMLLFRIFVVKFSEQLGLHCENEIE